MHAFGADRILDASLFRGTDGREGHTARNDQER